MKTEATPRNLFAIKAGDRVTGTYCDVRFSGTVNPLTRCHTANRNMLVFIDLDRPITVLGETRSDVLIEAGPDCPRSGFLGSLTGWE